MTYAQNTPTFKEAERTFSRGRTRGTVTADYEPRALTYHASFWRQYRWHLVGYALLMIFALISLVSAVGYDAMRHQLGRSAVVVELMKMFYVFNCATLPVSMLVWPAPLVWYSKYNKLKAIADMRDDVPAALLDELE